MKDAGLMPKLCEIVLKDSGMAMPVCAATSYFLQVCFVSNSFTIWNSNKRRPSPSRVCCMVDFHTDATRNTKLSAAAASAAQHQRQACRCDLAGSFTGSVGPYLEIYTTSSAADGQTLMCCHQEFLLPSARKCLPARVTQMCSPCTGC